MSGKASMLAMAAVFALTPMASGELLYSFEDDALGSSLNGAGVIVNSGNGITDGSQAIRLSDSTGNFDKIGHFFMNGLADPNVPITEFSVDWYWEAGPNSAGGWNGLTVGMYNQATDSFLQLNGTGEYIDQTAGGNGQYTVTYSLSPSDQAFIMGALQAGDPLEFGMYSNKDGDAGGSIKVNGTYTVDKVEFDGVLIPEPASLALLGLGAVAVLRRR